MYVHVQKAYDLHCVVSHCECKYEYIMQSITHHDMTL